MPPRRSSRRSMKATKDDESDGQADDVIATDEEATAETEKPAKQTKSKKVEMSDIVEVNETGDETKEEKEVEEAVELVEQKSSEETEGTEVQNEQTSIADEPNEASDITEVQNEESDQKEEIEMENDSTKNDEVEPEMPKTNEDNSEPMEVDKKDSDKNDEQEQIVEKASDKKNVVEDHQTDDETPDKNDDVESEKEVQNKSDDVKKSEQDEMNQSTDSQDKFELIVLDEIEDDEGGSDEVKKRSAEDVDEPPKKKSKSDAKGDDGKPKRSPELAKFWKAVEEDPSDFTGWTYLLQFVDANASLDEGREAFDAFLFRYPYCYGYWKKYADFEKRKATQATCLAVFERGMKAIPLSADLWIHYMNYVKAEFTDNESFVREQYNRAIDACGREWRSDKLWDHYVKWELGLLQETPPGDGIKDFSRVFKIYDRILKNPTQGLSHQFDMFRDFVKEHNPKDMLDVNEFLTLRKEILVSLVESKKGSEEAKEVLDEGAPPGEDDSRAKTDEENQAMRENIIFARKKVFKETEEKVNARYKFEEQIKRPYFHIKPLERAQLKNWNDYLDFEMKQNDPTQAEILFERCLIACALYEEYWTKYTDWMMSRLLAETDEKEKEKLADKIRGIFYRACTHHLTKKVDIHLAWSAFEETQSNVAKAIEIIDTIEKSHPLMMNIQMRKINAQRRQDNLDEVHKLYKSYIKSSKTTALRTDWSIKYARFLRMKCEDDVAALKVLEEALEVDEKNGKLYLQLLDIHLHSRPIDEAKIIAVFDQALTEEKDKKLNDKQRLLFAQRKAEFLEELGAKIEDVLSAQEYYSKLSAADQKSDSTHHRSSSRESYSSKRSSSPASHIKTVESSSSRHKSNGSQMTYEAAAANSSSYSAHHANSYQQYGSRYGYQQQGYNQYPSNYYGYGGGNY